jgi:hydroxypyruvate isomerase
MPRFAANLSTMYTEHAFLDRFGVAAADGFDAVEFMFELIDALGWDGHIGCEYRPRAGTSAGLGWLHADREISGGNAP